MLEHRVNANRPQAPPGGARGVDFLAYFLPGFHADPCNDAWWGEGWTEWELLKTARPLHEGHVQPVVPTDGFYDLARPEVLAEQFVEMRRAGISAAVIYDYWYPGCRPLSRVIETILGDPSLPAPFCVSWGNHGWSRTWRNRRGALDMLVEQEYALDSEWFRRQLDHYLRCFSDPRYFHYRGKPYFQIYKPTDLPGVERVTDRIREHAARRGAPVPHISGVVNRPLRDYGELHAFDSITLGNPTLGLHSPANLSAPGRSLRARLGRLRFAPGHLKSLLYLVQDLLPDRPSRHDYAEVCSKILRQSAQMKQQAPVEVLLSAFVGFDNTPRYKGRATIVEGVSADIFEETLRKLLALEDGPERPLLFVNAWNEWGEGMQIERSNVYGDSFCEVLRRLKGQPAAAGAGGDRRLRAGESR